MDTEETLDVSTEEETSLNENPSAEVATDEPFVQEEEMETSSDDEPQTLYADRFSSVEELEKSYKNTSAESTRLAQELAQLRKDLEESKLTPEEKKFKQESQDFVKSNELVTKQDLKDERDAGMLLSNGATQGQIDHVMQVSRLSGYANKSIPQIYKEVYGVVPKKKPSQGVRSKSTPRSTGAKTISRSAFSKLDVTSPKYSQVESQLLSGKMKLVD